MDFPQDRLKSLGFVTQFVVKHRNNGLVNSLCLGVHLQFLADIHDDVVTITTRLECPLQLFGTLQHLSGLPNDRFVLSLGSGGLFQPLRQVLKKLLDLKTPVILEFCDEAACLQAGLSVCHELVAADNHFAKPLLLTLKSRLKTQGVCHRTAPTIQPPTGRAVLEIVPVGAWDNVWVQNMYLTKEIEGPFGRRLPECL